MMNDANNQNDKKANPIRENLENQFQNFRPDEEVPENLKSEVFSTLDTLNLLGDVVDLFTVKFTQAESELLGLIRPPEANLETDEA